MNKEITYFVKRIYPDFSNQEYLGTQLMLVHKCNESRFPANIYFGDVEEAYSKRKGNDLLLRGFHVWYSEVPAKHQLPVEIFGITYIARSPSYENPLTDIDFPACDEFYKFQNKISMEKVKHHIENRVLVKILLKE